MLCILCKCDGIEHFLNDSKRDYLYCTNCGLVFVHPTQRVTPDIEFQRYELHQNNPENEGYISFLKRMYTQISNRIDTKGYGLDFGSGPTPLLSNMFKDNGYSMNIFDYYYANNRSFFTLKYDFITATEVIEHLYNPDIELNNLWACLKPGGYLGIMTKLLIDKKNFEKWYYKEDITHVAFYSEKTFYWLKNRLKASMLIIDDEIVLIRKI